MSKPPNGFARGGGIGRFGRTVALPLQIARQRVADRHFVVNQQDMWAGLVHLRRAFALDRVQTAPTMIAEPVRCQAIV